MTAIAVVFVRMIARARSGVTAAARTLETLETAIADALDAFALDECANYFTALGYEPE